jgi:hypothetical protein
MLLVSQRLLPGEPGRSRISLLGMSRERSERMVSLSECQ